jgi:hypothetical protein
MMDSKIIFSLVIALALFTASTITAITTTNIFAQNASKKINQTKEGAGAASMNKTNVPDGNGTQGAGAALQNQTSKGLSSAAGSIIQGVKGLFGGGNGQK